MQYWLIVPAAGTGQRFGSAEGPKQYALLGDRTVIEWACEPFVADARCRGAVFALQSDDSYWPAVRARLQAKGLQSMLQVDGGAARVHSVRNALRALVDRVEARDLVLVHDAARPCLLRADIDALLAAAAAGADAALLAAPLAETLKRAQPPTDTGVGGDADRPIIRVAETLPRERLWRALTPQLARYATLCAALDAALAASRLPTDESQALEWHGVAVQIVAGAASNIKITKPEDLAFAQALIRARSHASVDDAARRVR